MSGRPRDTQRKRLYDWERVNLRDCADLLPLEMRTPMSEEYAQLVVDEVWRHFGPGPVAPRVRVMGNRGRGAYLAHLHEIRLAVVYDATLCAWYVLHETAHAIAERAGQREAWASHGPEFAALYAHLLSRVGGAASEEDIRGSMRGAGLKVAPWERIAWLDRRNGLPAAEGDA